MSFWYNFYYFLLFPFQKLLYPTRVSGKENIIDGAAILCANHVSLLDAPLVAYSFGHKRHIFFMAKKELLDIPIAGSILKAVGVFPVTRGETDINAVRTSMKHLKSNEKIMIFPEGTRVTESESVEAKTGAVRIASKMKCPIIPIYVKREKKLFTRTYIFIGKPFSVEMPKDKNFEPLANLLLKKIYELEPKQ